MQNLTLTPTWGAAVPVPEDGELVTAAVTGAGRGPIRPGLQELGNRTQYLKVRADLLDALLGLGQRARPWVASFDGNTLIIGPTGPLVFPDGAGGYAVARISSESSFNISGSLDAGALSSNSWYYVYGYLSAGNVLCEISLTGPDSGRRVKNGNPSRIYFGSFRTVNGTTVVPFSAVNGVCRYVNSDPQSSTAMVITSTTAPTSETALDIGAPFNTCGAVPTGTRHVLFSVRVTNANIATAVLLFRATASGSGVRRSFAPGASDGFNVELPLDNSQIGYYSSTVTSLTVTIEVLGYTE